MPRCDYDPDRASARNPCKRAERGLWRVLRHVKGWRPCDYITADFISFVALDLSPAKMVDSRTVQTIVSHSVWIITNGP